MSQASGNEKYYVRFRGRVTGPFAITRLIEMRQAGQLSPFCELSPDRQRWESASAVLDPVSPSVPSAVDPPHQTAATGERWHYADARGVQHGPVSRDQLVGLYRNGQLGDDTKVWKKGMPDWVSLASPELGLVDVAPTAGSPAAGPAYGTPIPSAFRWASLGSLLLSIGLWLSVAALAGLTLWFLVAWLRDKPTTTALAAPGVLGVGNWLVSLVGIAFCLAGPPRNCARPMAITAAALSGLHLFLLLFVADEFRVNDSRLDLLDPARPGGRLSPLVWVPIASCLPLTSFTFSAVVSDGEAADGGVALLLVTGFIEAARLVTLVLALRGLALTAGSRGAAKLGLATAIAIGGVVFTLNLLVLLLVKLRPEDDLTCSPKPGPRGMRVSDP